MDFRWMEGLGIIAAEFKAFMEFRPTSSAGLATFPFIIAIENNFFPIRPCIGTRSLKSRCRLAHLNW